MATATKLTTQEVTFFVEDHTVEEVLENRLSQGWELAGDYPGGRKILTNPKRPGTVLVLEPHTP